MTIFNKFFKNHLTIPQAINLFEEIKSQTHPDIADLKRLVNFHKAPIGTKDELQALDLKYRAQRSQRRNSCNQQIRRNHIERNQMRSYESMLGLVRKTDIYEELRLGHMTLDNDEDRSTVRRTLVMQANDEIDLDILKAYLEAEKEYGDTDENLRYRALQLKYDALTTVPSTIEKTMTPAQLYSSNSPLWAHDYKAVTIECILPHLKDKPRTEETFNEALATIFKPKIHMDKFGRTYIN